MAVVDASVALKWALEEEHSAEAATLIERDEHDLNAPDIFRAEVANGLYKRIRQGKMELSEAQKAYTGIMAVGVAILTSGDDIQRRALELAATLQHNAVYDCIYLALAERLDTPFITADYKFIEKIKPQRLSVEIISLAQLH